MEQTASQTVKQSRTEIDQLTTEIDRVAETTKFNETYLLKGDENKTQRTDKVFSAPQTFLLEDVMANGSTFEVNKKKWMIQVLLNIHSQVV